MWSCQIIKNNSDKRSLPLVSEHLLILRPELLQPSPLPHPELDPSSLLPGSSPEGCLLYFLL